MKTGLLGLLIGLGAAGAAQASDAIVSIANNANAGVIVRVDGNFGCRAESKATAPPDMDSPFRCSFGTTVGPHVLDFRYDDGKSGSRSVAVPQTGYALTLSGNE